MIQQFLDCFARWNAFELTVGNAALERSYRLESGMLQPGRLYDRASDKTAAVPCEAIPLPFGVFERFAVQCAEEDNGGLSEPFFSVTLEMENAAAVQKLRIELFPGLPFYSSRFLLQPKGEKRKEGLPADDVLERLALPSAHCRISAIELFDKTDRNDTLVRVTEDSPAPAMKSSYCGDVFLLRPTADTPALLLAKDAPVGTSHLLRPRADLQFEKGRITLYGSGMDFLSLSAGEETEAYGVTVGLGAAEELKVRYKRLLCCRKIGEGRLFTMANTWGDRNCEKSLCEEFLRKELESAEKAGVDVLQIDDGWETGAIDDPERYMDHVWEGYHGASENYWSVNAGRFPRGLEPIAEEAKRRGVALGLWFSPDSADDFANWRADAKILADFRRRLGVRYFKLDGVNVRSKTGDRNFSALMQAAAGSGAALQLDVTAGDRLGYHYKPQYGVLFVENRYSDWGNYFPYRTLRNLWMLSSIIPARAMQFEVLNPRRHPEQYENDPFAPGGYEMDFLFASVMVSNPLLWCELSRLEPGDAAALQRIIAAWRPHCAALFSADVRPVGEEPSGRSCTGFWATCSSGGGYFVLLREKSDCETAVYQLPGLAGKTLEVNMIASNGSGVIESSVSADGAMTVHFSRPDQYLFAEYRVCR